MVYFYLSICLSAFSLFLVEPLIGKTFLPWFGGSAAVWSTALLYFQLLLTGGYAYAAWMLQRTKRTILHIILVGASLLLLFLLGSFWRSPITPPNGFIIVGSLPPIPAIFILLTISIGFPFFLLASNSTLAQGWLQRLFPARPAYRLYALSNAASLVALVCYPILIEPNLTIPKQGWAWTMLYTLFAAVTLFSTVRVMRRHGAAGTSATEPGARPSSRDISLWLCLSGCASILLLSITNYLTQQVAVIPFLWVLPLALYLLSFVLTFSGERWYPRQFCLYALVPVILLYDLAMANGARLGIPLQVVIFSLVLFLGCMVCNGELYRLKPPAGRMPMFYLIISAGGALGAVFVNFIAPILFKGYWELPLGVLFFCALFLLLGRGSRGPGLKGEIISRVTLSLLGVAVLVSLVRLFTFVGGDLATAVETRRNFYGVLRVRQVGTTGQNDISYQMINGSTIHGAQFLGEGERNIPTVYYGPQSGVGLALLNYPRPAAGLHVGALGLGVGTVAAYGKPGDTFRFYEINSAVIQLAEGQRGYFSFLADSPAKVEIINGDARLSLEREASANQAEPFDIMILDVFSGDAVPVHLLDEQAFSLYLDRLAPAGILAVHITNGYLDLVPVVWTLADHFNLQRALILDAGDGHYTSASTWVLLAREASFLSTPAIAGHSQDMNGYAPSIRMWTDEYSNLFQLLKR